MKNRKFPPALVLTLYLLYVDISVILLFLNGLSNDKFEYLVFYTSSQLFMMPVLICALISPFFCGIYAKRKLKPIGLGIFTFLYFVTRIILIIILDNIEEYYSPYKWPDISAISVPLMVISFIIFSLCLIFTKRKKSEIETPQNIQTKNYTHLL